MNEPGMLHLMWALSFAPFVFAWRDNAGTTIRPTLVWAVAAWLAWGVALAAPTMLARFVALSLTGAAGVAALGARRPGVEGWNFVVVALMVVLSLAWIEGIASGNPLHLGGFRLVFLGAVVATASFNYLPTRLGLGALSLGIGCVFELGRLIGTEWPNGLPWIFAAPFAAWLGTMTAPNDASADTIWTTFRDRFGAIWALRVREQFQSAADNAERSVTLRWNGVETNPNDVEWCVNTLTAVTSRFRLQSTNDEFRTRQPPINSG